MSAEKAKAIELEIVPPAPIADWAEANLPLRYGGKSRFIVCGGNRFGRTAAMRFLSAKQISEAAPLALPPAPSTHHSE